MHLLCLRVGLGELVDVHAEQLQVQEAVAVELANQRGNQRRVMLAPQPAAAAVQSVPGIKKTEIWRRHTVS